MRLSLILLFSLLISVGGDAQGLTGIWRGSFYNEYEYLFTGNKYRYEVQIKETDGAIKGVTYSYQNTRFYGKASTVGKWTSSTKNVILKENKMMDLKITGGGDGCLMTCYLEYRKEGDREFLVGTYTSVNMNNDSISCGGGVVRLEKVPDSDFEKEDFLKETTKVPPPSGKVKPGQEDFLVKKTPAAPPKTNSGSTAKTSPSAGAKPKPAAPAAKPPVAKNTTPANGQKPANNASGAPKAPTNQQQPVAKSGTKPAPKPPATKPATTKPATPAPPAATAKETKPATQGSGSELKNTTIEKAPAKDPVVTKPVEKSSTIPKTIPTPEVLKNRKNELVETMDLTSRKVEVSFYDNGEVDGDTISVYYNNRLIASRKGLNAQGFQLDLELDENVGDHQLVMVAENLGSIPPNTALMIVKSGGQQYTLRMSSTEQKNAMVKFRYTGPTP